MGYKGAIASRKKLENRRGTQLAFSHCITGGGPDGPARDTARSIRHQPRGSRRAQEIPMRRFLNKLFRDCRTTSTARGSRRAPRRATLQVEGLEDRLVMSTVSPVSPFPPTTASQNGSTLNIGAGQLGSGVTVIYSDGAGHIDVSTIGAQPQFAFASFTISSIKTVNITGLGGAIGTTTGVYTSAVYIDDSKGLPFAPGTTISLSGSNTSPSNVLYLGGSTTLGTNETYVPGSISTLHLGGPGGLSVIRNTPATLSLNNLNIKFVLSSSFGGGITDNLPITGNLDVQTSGTQVQLYGDGGYQPLSGLGNGAGSVLVYSGKPSVTLDTFAPNASIFLGDGAVGASNFTVNMHGAGETIFLDAPDPAVGYSYFTVNMQGAGETTTLDQTPKNVTTVVNVDQPATNAKVALWGNFGPVIIDGDSSTGVNIGYPLASTGTITSGIEANVTVEGASYLAVDNSGNTSTFEQVTVTEHTISGSGLFGNSNVTLTYGGIPTLDIYTGQLADGYRVAPSSPAARFTSNITIDSSSYWAFYVNVDVDRASHLNLTLFNRQPQKDAGGGLDVTERGVGGSLDFSHTVPNGGTVDAIFSGRTTSRIFYNGFDSVS
jgi:hypothetical protein